jgi:TetR/AcrR family transcriptional repressor of nem operon
MDDTVTALLDAFWRQGFGATSIPDLSAATGLLPGSLYAAFGSKDEMFRLALKRYAAWLGGEMPAGVTGLEGIEAALNTIVRLTVEDPARRGCPMLNAIAESAELSSETRADLQSGMARMRRMFRTRLQEAQAHSGRNADLPRLEALLFAAAVSIRVLGRAKAEARLLQDIADGAVASARALLGANSPTSGGRKWKIRNSSKERKLK